MNLRSWPLGWPLVPLLLCVLGATLAFPEPVSGRRRRRLRPATAGASTPARPEPLGQPRTLVVYRRDVATFADVAEALRRRSAWAVSTHPLDPSEGLSALREELAAQRPVVVLSLGRFAERVTARGVGHASVVFAFRSRPPATTVPRGGWLAIVAAPEDVLRWATRLRPGLRRLGVLLRGQGAPQEEALRRAAARRGVTPVLARVPEHGNPLRAVVGLLQERVDAIWLGASPDGWTSSRLRGAVRLQALFGVPMLGVTREHVRAGLVLAIDSAPEAVAAALDDLLRGNADLLVRGGRSHLAPSRRRATAPAPAARQLVSGVLSGRRVSLNERAARALGLDPRAALVAGAVAVPTAGRAP